MKSIRNVLAGSLLAGSALVAAATGISTAMAQAGADAATTGEPSGGHGWHHHHGGVWHLYSKLGLTDAQKASIKSILTASKPQREALFQQMQANHLKLSQATPGTSAYTSAVAEVAQSNATLASERTTQESELRAQMYAVLTAPQKTQLASLQAEWAAKAAARQAARASGQPAQ